MPNLPLIPLILALILIRDGRRGYAQKPLFQPGLVPAISWLQASSKRIPRCLRVPGDWVAGLSTDATNLLEKINRYGAAAQLAGVFESLGFSYRTVLDQLQQLTGRAIRVVRVVGGGSLNRFFCQTIANATGRKVIAGPAEATAFGNVMAQAVATGHLPNLAAAAEAMKGSVECQTYQPKSSGGWDEAYARFGSLMNAAGSA
jgi:sugar (pentulose or hexulose) kinase